MKKLRSSVSISSCSATSCSFVAVLEFEKKDKLVVVVVAAGCGACESPGLVATTVGLNASTADEVKTSVRTRHPT